MRQSCAVCCIVVLAFTQEVIGAAPPVPASLDAVPPGAFSLLGSPRFRHRGGVSSVAYSPDGKFIASGGWSDGTVKVQRANGEVVWRLQHAPLSRLIRHVAFSPNGKRLVSVADDNSVRLWDLATGRSLAVLQSTETKFDAVAYSPNGTRLATAENDGSLRLWNADGIAIRRLAEHSGVVSAVVFSADGKLLASAGEKGVRVWDADTGARIEHFVGFERYIGAVAISPDGGPRDRRRIRRSAVVAAQRCQTGPPLARAKQVDHRSLLPGRWEIPGGE